MRPTCWAASSAPTTTAAKPTSYRPPLGAAGPAHAENETAGHKQFRDERHGRDFSSNSERPRQGRRLCAHRPWADADLWYAGGGELRPRRVVHVGRILRSYPEGASEPGEGRSRRNPANRLGHASGNSHALYRGVAWRLRRHIARLFGPGFDPGRHPDHADHRHRDGARSDQAFLQAAARGTDPGHLRPSDRCARNH